jgi:Tfp pilus assembly protein PilE
MIKMSNKGFFLAETIVAVAIVATVLVIFYTQISSLYRNYERNAKYNTVEALHAARNISTYIDQNYTDKPIGNLITTDTPLIDITSYDFDTTGYYDSLISNLNIKNVYFSSYNINNLITNYTSYNIGASFLDFLRTLRVINDKTNTYRVIVQLNNGEYASANLVLD